MWLLLEAEFLAIGTMALGAVWFLVFGVWFVPHEAGGKTVYGGLYGSLGDTPAQVARRALTHPGEVVDRLKTNDAPSYARDLVTPYGFVPLAAPEALLSIANCEAELKDNKAARKTIGELIKLYPKSEAAQAGRERLASLK